MPMDIKKFGKRLKKLMKDYGETTYSMSKVVKLSAPTISRYTRGEMVPKITTVEILANYFNVSPKWLSGESDIVNESEMLDNNVLTTTIPVFETVQYKLPIFSNKKINEELRLPTDLISNWGNVIAVEAPDDSMKPLINKGDKMVIKLGDAELNTSLAAIHINKKDMVIRKVVNSGKFLILQPANFNYSPEIINPNQDNIKVVGKVVYAITEKDTNFEK